MKPAKISAAVTIEKRADGRVVPVKWGEFGGSASGKTYTAGMFALGLSIQLHGRAPVYVYDTEPGWQFLAEPFRVEGVKLIQEVGESFDGLRAARQKAEKSGACVFIGDSYTHIWNDLMKSFMGRGGYVEFQDWNQIKPLWRDWTREFLNSPMHCGALGRLGWNYNPEEDERTGKVKQVKTDSKFNAGGGESFGYEPHLLLELELVRIGSRSGRGGVLTHNATVLKDRAQVLTGEAITFASSRGYAKGDYAGVWNRLAAHVQQMQRIDNHVLIPAGATQGSKQYDSTGYRAMSSRAEIVIETMENTLGVKLFPGQTGEAKRAKLAVIEQVFALRSWKGVQELPLAQLEQGMLILYALEKRMQAEQPADEAMLAEMVKQSMEDVTNPGNAKHSTIEQMLTKSVEKVQVTKAERLNAARAEVARQQA